MSNYNQGARAEYKLAKYLWEDGWWVVRQAASGSVGHEACDVAAFEGEEVLLFEVKTGELPIRFDDQLVEAEDRIRFKSFDGGVYAAYYDGSTFYYVPYSQGIITEENKEMLVKLIR